MFSTIKKMIHKEKPEDKKPILDIEKDSSNFNFKEESFDDDYSLPEPQDINKLPLPETSRKASPTTGSMPSFSSPVERERRERIDNFRKTREEPKRVSFEPPPVKPLREYPPKTTAPVPTGSFIQEPNIPKSESPEKKLSMEILNRLESIENRLSRIEQIMKISTENERRY